MKFNLNRRDLWLACPLLVIAVIMLGSTWFGARQVEAYMIEKQAENAVFKWARFVELHLADINQILFYGRTTQDDKALVAAMAEANDVLSYRFFNRAGFIVWSSDPGEVGRRDVNTYLSDVVLAGGTFIKLQADRRFSGLEPDLHAGSAVAPGAGLLSEFDGQPGVMHAQAYSAVMEDGRFNGAIEVHVDVTRTAELVREIMGMARWAMVGFVGLMSIATAMLIVRTLRDRNRELAELRIAQGVAAQAESEIRRLNAELERRCAEQSDELKAVWNRLHGGGSVAAG